MVKVKAQFKRRSTANNVEIYVPVPDDADTPKFRVSVLSSMLPFHVLTQIHRHRLVACSTCPTSLRLCGRSSSSVVAASSSCARTSGSPAFAAVSPCSPNVLPLATQGATHGRARVAGQARADHSQVRDSVLHRVRHPGALPQDRREERVPGAALGALHHAERRRLQVRLRRVLACGLYRCADA